MNYPYRTNPQMFVPNSTAMASDGLHNLVFDYTNPLFIHGSSSHNFLQPTWSQFLDHRLRLPQIYGSDVIPIYGNSTAVPEPCAFMLSHLTYLSVVSHYQNTYEWDLLSDFDISISQPDISTIMNYNEESVNLPIPHAVLMSEKRLCERLKGMYFGSLSHVYNPLVYAFEAHQDYLRKYCCTEKAILFLGMNPGQFGMVQNGVPFGDIKTVKEWLKVKGTIYSPKYQHPERTILGWSATRPEVSGRRLWGLIRKKSIFFFNHCFVHNYCPLAFLDSDGHNISLSDLPLDSNDRDQLNKICDESLLDILKVLEVKWIICIGKFVESSVERVLEENKLSEIKIRTLVNPSQRNRMTTEEWEAGAMQELKDIGFVL